MSVHGAAYGVVLAAFGPATLDATVPDSRFGEYTPLTCWSGAPEPCCWRIVKPPSRSPSWTSAGALPSFLTVSFAVVCSPNGTFLLMLVGLTTRWPAASAKSDRVVKLFATFTLLVRLV